MVGPFSTQQNVGTQLWSKGCAVEETLLQAAPPPSLYHCCPGLLPGHSWVDFPTSLADIRVEAQKSPTLPTSPSWRCSGFSRAAIRPDVRRTGACCAAQSVPGFSRAGEQTKKQIAEVTEMGRGWRTGRELNYFHESLRCFAQHAVHGVIPHRFHQRASAGELYGNQSGAALEQWGLHGGDLLLWFTRLHSQPPLRLGEPRRNWI